MKYPISSSRPADEPSDKTAISRSDEVAFEPGTRVNRESRLFGPRMAGITGCVDTLGAAGLANRYARGLTVIDRPIGAEAAGGRNPPGERISPARSRVY